MTDSAPSKKSKSERRTVSEASVDELPIIEISDRMYRLAELIAEARQLTYEPIGGGRVYGDQTSIEAIRTGVLGELAVQKLTDNFEQIIFLRGDPGFDLVKGDTTIDVKTTATHLEIPDLLIPYDQDLVADVYLLAHRLKDRQIRLVGWAPRHLVADREPEKYPGDQLNYVIRPDELYIL